MSYLLRLKDFITSGKYTHFFEESRGISTIFEMTQCENCKENIQGPNPAKIQATREILEEIGLTKMNKLPEEGYFSEGLGHEACHNCQG